MRQIFKGGGMNIIETAPTTRTLISQNYESRYGSGKKGYTIALPYVQYSQINNGLFVTFTNKPMASFDDLLYPQPFGQTFEFGLTCLQLEYVAENVHHLKTLINMYYGSPFSHTLLQVPAIQANTFGNLSHWEKKTQANPNFATEVKWWMKPCTIADMCTYDTFPHLTPEHKAMPFQGMSLAKRLEHVKNKTVPEPKSVQLHSLQPYERILFKFLLQNNEQAFLDGIESIFSYKKGTSSYQRYLDQYKSKFKSVAYKNITLKHFEDFNDAAYEKQYFGRKARY